MKRCINQLQTMRNVSDMTNSGKRQKEPNAAENSKVSLETQTHIHSYSHVRLDKSICELGKYTTDLRSTPSEALEGCPTRNGKETDECGYLIPDMEIDKLKAISGSVTSSGEIEATKSLPTRTTAIGIRTADEKEYLDLRFDELCQGSHEYQPLMKQVMAQAFHGNGYVILPPPHSNT